VLLPRPDASGLGAAQQELNFPRRTVTIRRFEAKIHVDGRLDEPVWSQLEPTGEFFQTEPDEGKPSTERTEVFLFYDSHNLYFGFKCYDSEPEKIVARLGPHDSRQNSDVVFVFLDPFGDRRNGYSFSVSAGGVQTDTLVSEASGQDSTWDGIWESEVRIEDWGWVAEVAIPFKSVRFSTDRPWGFNLGRDIVRKDEKTNWQFVPRFEGHIYRPSKAGWLEGIEGVETGRNLEIIPYFSARARRGAPDPLDDGERYEGGVDLRWGLLPNATLNLTVNPDFAETEADEQNITISRFELFFPEKRTFFNEGSNFFSTPLNLFFTRRVGQRLPDGIPQRILLGAKLTGRLNGWSLGLLEARTQERRFIASETDLNTGVVTSTNAIAPAANFFVLRLQRDIFHNSSMGFLTVNRDQEAGDIGSTQRVHAFDLNIVSGPYLKWSNQVAYNQNETQPAAAGGIHRVGLRSHFNYETNDWEFRARYKYLGRGFDVSEIGFEPETDRHSGVAAVEWKPFIDRFGIRQLFFELNQDISLNTRGELEDSGSDAEVSAEFKNFWFARARYSYDRVRFNEFASTPNCPAPFACTPAFDAGDRTRVYITPRLRFNLNTNRNRAIYFNYEFLWRKFAQFREKFYGRGQEHSFGLTARILSRTRLEVRGNVIQELLLDGTPFQTRRLFITRLQHQFTHKLRARVLAQVSNDRLGQNFNVNSIVAYDFTARSAAIVGYNYQKQAPGRVGDLGNEFFMKFSYLFHF